jgi:hypothetical protein
MEGACYLLFDVENGGFFTFERSIMNGNLLPERES